MAARPGSPEPHVCIPQCVWCDDQLCSLASPFSVDGLVVIQAEPSRPQTPPPQDRLQALCTPHHPIQYQHSLNWCLLAWLLSPTLPIKLGTHALSQKQGVGARSGGLGGRGLGLQDRAYMPGVPVEGALGLGRLRRDESWGPLGWLLHPS